MKLQYQCVRLIAKGTNCEVWQGVGPLGESVAIKFKPAGLFDETNFDEFVQVKDLRHPHMLTIRAFFATEKGSFFVYGPEKGVGSLFTFVCQTGL